MYLIKIVGPAGRETFVGLYGKEVSDAKQAEQFNSERGAEFAAKNFKARRPNQRFITLVEEL